MSIHADDATLSFLAEAGFAMLMLTVGMHVPLRDRRLRRALGPGALAAGVAAIAAPLGGLVVAELTGTGHVAVYAVLLASGSAAVVLPTLQERKLDGPEALVVIAQVTVADVAAILAVPARAPAQPGRRRRSLAACSSPGAPWSSSSSPDRCARAPGFTVCESAPSDAVGRWICVSRWPCSSVWPGSRSKAAPACSSADSRMGLVVAAIGGPKRLSTQVRGVAEGFFVPLFFVVLGARLDVSALVDHPDLLLVTAALIVLNLVIHALAALATRQPPSAGLIATAQLGVPAAVVQIGLQEHVITPALGAAVTLAALATLGLCALGTDLLARRTEPLRGPRGP